MSEFVFTANQESSAAYFNALNEYMENNVLHPDNGFICKYGEKCEASCRADNREFYPGQLSHVGPLYDLKRDGKPFRVIISGAEYGYPEKPHSLKDRTEVVNNCVPDNPHMRGTLCLLQVLFGEEPDNGALDMTINGKSEKIFHAFSLSNYLLCSGIQNESPTMAFTGHMTKYCRDHYQKTLEILQPQMVILEGGRAWEFFWERYDISLNHRNPAIETIEVGENPILVLPLYHPSYRGKFWGAAGSKALREYVKPAVDELLTKYEKIHG